MIVIDRFGEDFAVLEIDGEITEVPRNIIPDDAREGDILVLDNGVYSVDEKATSERRNSVRDRLYRLMKKDND